MGKKTSNTAKEPAPIKRAAKPAPKVATKRKPVAVKGVRKTAATKAPAYTHEDIALRAYFIGEKRQTAGWPGDTHQDWIEAERQLAAEAASAGKPKAAKAKAKKA